MALLAMSPDPPADLRKTVARHDLSIPLYSDPALTASRGLGIAFGAAGRQLPVPAVFLFDGDGRITFQYVNPRYSVRLDPRVLLAAAAATAGT